MSDQALAATCNYCRPPERVALWSVPDHLRLVHGLAMELTSLTKQERRSLHRFMWAVRRRRRLTPRWRRVLD